VDLFQQSLHTIKFQFIAQAFYKLQFQLLAVQVAIEIQNVGFHVGGLLVRCKSRVDADVDRSGQFLFPDTSPTSIDPIGRANLVNGVIDIVRAFL